jgi:hypothetical protein
MCGLRRVRELGSEHRALLGRVLDGLDRNHSVLYGKTYRIMSTCGSDRHQKHIAKGVTCRSCCPRKLQDAVMPS